MILDNSFRKAPKLYYLVTSKSRLSWDFLKIFLRMLCDGKNGIFNEFQNSTFFKKIIFEVNLSTHCLLIHQSDQWYDSWENTWEIKALYHSIFLVDESSNKGSWSQPFVVCRILKGAKEKNLFVTLLTLSRHDDISSAELNPSYNTRTQSCPKLLRKYNWLFYL